MKSGRNLRKQAAFLIILNILHVKVKIKRMKNQIVVSGIVLQVMQIGDYDRRVTILTKELGKIGAFARGARRPGSALLSYTQPCVFGEFTLYAGKNSYQIIDVSVKNAFPELRMSVEKAYYGMFFAEVADFFTREGNDERQMLGLLYASLRALVAGNIEDELVRAVFELKTMCISGEAPLISECTVCHKKDMAGRFFSFHGHGVVCEACAGRVPAGDRRLLDESTWYAIWFIEANGPEKLYTFRLSEEVLDELSDVAEKYLLARTNHEFNGLALLKFMSNKG